MNVREEYDLRLIQRLMLLSYDDIIVVMFMLRISSVPISKCMKSELHRELVSGKILRRGGGGELVF